ncbi:MAG: DUF2892 domain-containing protein [Bacteroidales bacterium]
MKINVSEPGRWIRPVAGIVALLLGGVFMLIPFIPLGYILLFASIFILSPYIPGLKWLVNYFKKKDKSNKLDKVEDEIQDNENKLDNKLGKNNEKKQT